MIEPLLAYISQGQLYRQSESGGEILESPFGCSLRDRAAQIYNRHAWKTQGRGGQALSRTLRMPAERDPSEFRIAITSVSRGHLPGELLYTLETDEISGVFARDAEGIEKRLFHTADFRAHHPDLHPDGSEIALSVYHRNGACNLAVLKADGSGLTEVTDGESADQAPRWVPGPGRRLVFQSSGMARDAHGRFLRYGPFAVQQIDLESGDITRLAHAADCDFLWPRVAVDGTLYYIRRPNANAPKPADPVVALRETALLPFRILAVIGQLIQIFVASRTGRPLVPPQKEAGEEVVKAPPTWLLMRQPPQGAESAETVAAGVSAFDLAPDGSVIFSDEIDVYRIPAEGGAATKILSGERAELIAAL